MSSHEDLPDHVLENREYWDGMADKWVASGERAWAAAEPIWGIWSIPEREVGMLPAEMRGQEAIELGCGAAIWCDPYRWVPEAHRLLRPGGRLVFLGHTPLVQICSPPSGAPCEPYLHRDYFGLHRVDWSDVEIDPGGVEFNLSISEWFRLFRRIGFDVEDFLELQAPETPPGPAQFVPHEWARRWPSEQVWKLRKRLEKSVGTLVPGIEPQRSGPTSAELRMTDR